MGQTMSDCTSKRQECNEEISFGGKYSTLEINKENVTKLNTSTDKASKNIKKEEKNKKEE